MNTPSNANFISPISHPDKSANIYADSFIDRGEDSNLKSSTMKPPHYPPTIGQKQKSISESWLTTPNNENADLVQRHQALVEREKTGTQISKIWTGEKVVVDHQKSIKGPNRTNNSKSSLANPHIFSEEKPPMKTKKNSDFCKNERKGKASKKPKDRGNNKLSIIHLKRKHTRKTSIDGRSATKKVKKNQPTPSPKPGISNIKANNTKQSSEIPVKPKLSKPPQQIENTQKKTKDLFFDK
jgi:hypothetical protein